MFLVTSRAILILMLIPVWAITQPLTAIEKTACKAQARQVTIIRDNWGIPHVYGVTDADAVFGCLYAQCEDDFPRVEMNYIEKLGRMAEVKGETELYNDLLIRLVIDSSAAVKDYVDSPPWLKKLLDAYANGINFYMATHPQVKPLLLTKFKPWYPLLWTDGSIGAIDVSTITTNELKNFYSGEKKQVSMTPPHEILTTGSNGFAIAPAKTVAGNALLYINPHVTFYFRPEMQLSSMDGLNTYGAVTWGQFFIYQGFNEHCGWMHTSSYADVADLYAEQIVKDKNKWLYRYDGALRPVTEKQITLKFIDLNHIIHSKVITAFFTHHGPVMAEREGKWISVKANNRSVTALIQSWKRIKCNNLEAYKKNMDLRSNTSNNTVYADDKGNIAYWHGNFMPKRDTSFNWTKPVDGSTSRTEWQGLHTVNETIHVLNPATGWIQNCNSTPFTGSGSSSPRRENYPSYMAPDGQNFRGINASNILASADSFTLEKLMAAGYNTHLAAFDVLLPGLFRAYQYHVTDTAYNNLREAVGLLTAWNRNASDTSVATTLAVYWAEKLLPAILKEITDDEEADIVAKATHFANNASDVVFLQPLKDLLLALSGQFGKWQIPWGEINRYQRLTGNLNNTFADSLPSLPVGFVSSTWGCLPSFVSHTFPGTNKRYGYNGNSFICAVEFGRRVKAKSLLTGGESGNVQSPHFADQALMYTKGIFKDVLFYKEDVLKHAERKYHPGEEQ